MMQAQGKRKGPPLKTKAAAGAQSKGLPTLQEFIAARNYTGALTLLEVTERNAAWWFSPCEQQDSSLG